jgi:hypothetical protein
MGAVNRFSGKSGGGLGGKIIPLDLELRRRFDIWLSYHPDNEVSSGCGHDRLAGAGFYSRKIPVV